VYRDVALSWTPGNYASIRNVYFGTSFADVNAATAENPLNVLVGKEQVETTYDPTGNLAYGRTYFWRVDEVNEADGTIYPGKVWSFTVEPLVYTMTNINATASSSDPTAAPANTTDGSGLTDNLYHGNVETTMWLSNKTGPQPSWIQYEFDNVYKLEEMWAWNYNGLFETVLGLGMKDVKIEYSLNGTDWTLLRETQFPQAQGASSYEHAVTIDLAGLAAKYVRLTPANNWGGLSPQYGLSEVRFFYTPTRASDPTPEPAQPDVSPDILLQWRPGREAVSHQVYFSDDQQAVINGTAPAQTTAEAGFDPGSLLLAKTYSWRVDEINEAASPSLWQGTVWTFTTSAFLVVDDFESYTDDEGSRVYQFWIDGYDDPANGSQVGYGEAPFAERTTVHGGRQSMPLTYDNTSAAYSEAELTFDDAQDWTAHGVKTLSLYFYGPAENTTGQLYVKINGTRVNYAGAADDLKKAQWTQWTIDLSPLGVNLESIKTLGIGIEGASALGKLFIDDVQLLP